MKRVLTIVGLATFATSLSTRSVDPVIPQIAATLGVEASTAALLSTAFALPYALIQPVLGSAADILGKTRMMKACLVIAVAAAVTCASAPTFPILLGARVVAGIASGGIFPAGLALVADLVPLGQRQVAFSRLLFAGMSGNLLGASTGGLVGDLVGWRAVFVVAAVLGAVALVGTLWGLRAVPVERRPFDLKSVPASYRAIFANPRAKACFAAVFIEGVFIFGLFPYMALLLRAGGETRAAIAGLVLAGFGCGGIIYALSVGTLLELVGQRRLMFAGGAVTASALVAVALGSAWPLFLPAFAVLGFGFYLLHGAIHVYVTELAPMARAAATALHSTSFFLGQAIGPVIYGVGFTSIGSTPSLMIGAAVLVVSAVICVRLLHGRAPPA
jgi:predicted MFS family arabinose efflux permease